MATETVETTKQEKTKFYKILFQEKKPYLGKMLNQNPVINEGGGNYPSGSVMELTPSRMKQIGENYFQELSSAEHETWEKSGRTHVFPAPPRKEGK